MLPRCAPQVSSFDHSMMTTPVTATDRASARHHVRWGSPDLVVRAPGRVNLIGEHTDYNAGHVVPAAIEAATAVAVSATGDTASVVVDAEGFGTVTIDVANPLSVDATWAHHVAGCIGVLSESGHNVGGHAITIDTDIPVGAGVSSSAALIVAVLTALHFRDPRPDTAIELARCAQRVENDWVGVPSGIMDQLVIAGAVADCAMHIDCRDLAIDHVPVSDDVVIAVVDTGTRRRLVDGAYADRRDACLRAAAQLGITSLRDAEPGDLSALDDVVAHRRARHVVTENARVVDFIAALHAGDTAAIGALMAESHRSLRDDFEVSSPALDDIVMAATRAPGCIGARMTGGGFAGCAVALVYADATVAFGDAVRSAYNSSDRHCAVWFSRPSAGVSIVG